MKKKVYISGAIAHYDLEERRRAFADGFYKFRAQCAAVGDSGIS